MEGAGLIRQFTSWSRDLKQYQQQFVPDWTTGVGVATASVSHPVLNRINEQPSTKADQPITICPASDLVSDWPDESSGVLR